MPSTPSRSVNSPVRPTRFRAFKARVNRRYLSARAGLAERIAPAPIPSWDALAAGMNAPNSVATLDGEAQQWVHAHRDGDFVTEEPSEGTATLFADPSFQSWMGETLTSLGWIVTEPVMLSEGWVPARGERTATGQPATTFTTASKTSLRTTGRSAAGFARAEDPATSKKAGALAAANQSITVNSHQGQLLIAYAAQHTANPGVGFTAAEAVNAAGLRTDGATGSPWRRVTDLRDMGLVTFLLDDTCEKVARKNESNSDGAVLVITPLGLRATTALNSLAEHGYVDFPLSFDGHADAALFEDLPTTLARIDTVQVTGNSTATITATTASDAAATTASDAASGNHDATGAESTDR